MLRLLSVAMILLSTSIAAYAVAPTRGYVSRRCGFDLDNDGIIGELTDDCTVCDGSTTDPDGDLVTEDITYVDCDAGTDDVDCGASTDACATIAYALAGSNTNWSGRVDNTGPEEDIVCFKGTCAESGLNWSITNYSGPTGFYTVTKTGSEQRDWQYASNPSMLVGWDADGDQCYPPHDDGSTDVANCGTGADTAVIDGSGSSAYKTFDLDDHVSYVEFAHFEAKDHGRNVPPFTSGTNTAGFLVFENYGFDPGHQYVYFHDLKLSGINRAQDTKTDNGDYFTISIFNTHFDWLNFTNILFYENGGWFLRGVPHEGWGTSDAGPMRFKNITRVMLGPNGGSTVGMKPWGYITATEIIDSLWDTNIAGGAWTPVGGGGWANVAFNLGVCIQDWVLRNNEIIDTYIAVSLWGSAVGFCDDTEARTIDDIIVDRNIFGNTYAWNGYSGHGGIAVGNDQGAGHGDYAGETVEDVTITNNLVYSKNANGWEFCVLAEPGLEVGAVPGQIIIANNTCIGSVPRDAAGMIMIGTTLNNDPQQTYVQENFVVKNNVVDEMGAGQNNIIAGYLPTNFDSDYNVFDSGANYEVKGSFDVDNLPDWRTNSGEDANSQECQPTFVDAPNENYHLAANDSCAKDSGTNVSAYTTTDIDYDSRPQGAGWDIGADEFTEQAGGAVRGVSTSGATVRPGG